jgi:hypothetical protein
MLVFNVSRYDFLIVQIGLNANLLLEDLFTC